MKYLLLFVFILSSINCCAYYDLQQEYDSVYSGNYKIYDQRDLDEFQFSVIYGNLTIQGKDFNGLQKLKGLKRIYGDIFIRQTDFTDLNFLSGLRGADDLYLWDNKNLRTLSGLEGLEGLSLSIKSCGALESLEGLQNVRFMRRLEIENNGAITSLKGLENLDFLYELELIDCSRIETLEGVSLGKQMTEVILQNNKRLKDIDNILGLEEIYSKLSITGCDGIESITGFDSLRFIKKGLEISNNKGIMSIIGFGNLETIEEGGISIKKNLTLNRITGFGKLEEFSDKIEVTGNIELQDCCDLPFANNLSFSIIENNGIGCNNISEIATNCGLEKIYDGDLTITTQAFIDTFSYTHVNGDIRITGEEVKNLKGLNRLKKANGLYIEAINLNQFESFMALSEIDEIIIRNSGVSRIIGFNNLESVSGDIEISGHPSGSEWKIFDKLQSIGGSLRLKDNGHDGYIGFRKLTTIADSLYITNNIRIGHLNFLSTLQQVKYIYIKDNLRLKDCCNVKVLGEKATESVILENNSVDCGNYNEIFCSTDEVFNGNLTFDGDNPNRTYAGFPYKIINGDLRIYNESDFKKFNSLEKVTGNLQITVSDIKSFEGFNNLKEVGGTLHLRGIGTKKISGFINIKTLRGLYIGSSGGLEELDILPNLEQISSIEVMYNSALNYIKSFNKVESLDKLIVKENEALQNISFLPSLKEINNNLEIEGNSSLRDMSGLDMLERVGNRILIENNPSLLNFNGLGSLTNIGDNLYIYDNKILEDLTGLSSIEKIGRSLIISRNMSLLNVEGINQGVSFTGGITLLDNYNLESLAGFKGSKLPEVNNSYLKPSIQIINNGLYDLNGFPEILEEETVLRIENNDRLTNLEGLENVTKFRGIELISNERLKTLKGLENLESLGWITLRNNNDLIDITGLNKLKDVKELKLLDNENLINLRGLEELWTAEELVIKDNMSLNSLGGANNLRTVDRLIIDNNDNIERMALPLEIDSVNHLEIKDTEKIENIELPNIYINAVTYSKNPLLSDISGLENVNGLKNLFISDNNSLTVFNAQLPDTLNSLEINENDNLIDISFLNSVAFANTIQIHENAKLENLGGILPITKDRISIRYNPMLSDVCGLFKIFSRALGSYNGNDNKEESLHSLFDVDSPCVPLHITDSLALVDLYNSTSGKGWLQSWDLSQRVEQWQGLGMRDAGFTKKLDSLFLRKNALEGVVQNSFFDMQYLEYIDLSGNSLEGKFFGDLRVFDRLQHIDLSDNQFTDTLNLEFTYRRRLTYFDISENNFSGRIRFSNSFQESRLEHLDLSGNIFKGTIPNDVYDVQSLRYLDLSDNGYEGNIGAEIGNLNNLEVLDLSKNRLSGGTPFELINLQLIKSLNLSGNNLDQFNIDENDLKVFPLLESFNISSNNLEKIPYLYSIDTVDVSSNKLTFEDIDASLFQGQFFTYAPQDTIGKETSYKLAPGEDLFHVIGIDKGVSDNLYQWFKDGEIYNAFNSDTLMITDISTLDSGVYHCQITNPSSPELILVTRNVYVSIEGDGPVFTLQRNTIDEDITLDSFVSLILVDGVRSDEYSFSIENVYFKVSGDSLISKGRLDFERESTIDIILSATDKNDENFETELTIYINDVAEPSLWGKTVYESGDVTEGSAFIYSKEGINGDIAIDSTKFSDTPYFTFSDIPVGNYQIKVKPDKRLYPDLADTYYKRKLTLNEAESIKLNGIGDSIQVSLFTVKELDKGERKVSGKIFKDESLEGGRLSIITSGNGEAVEGVPVFLLSETTNGPVASTKTDNEGGFIFNLLPTGEYRLKIDYKGYPLEGQSLIDLQEDALLDIAIGGTSIFISEQEVTSLGTYENTHISIHLYPNPVENYLYLHFEDNRNDYKIRIYDSHGRQVDYKFTHEKRQLDVRRLKQGIYSLVLTHDMTQMTFNFIKL